MLKKTIKFTDYNGEEREEDFYFNMTRAEIAEMEMSVPGGFSAMVERISKEKDTKSIVSVFKDLILRSYGKRSDDGRRFIKSKELSEEFSQTEAYSELFMELASDATSAAAFVNGITPQERKTTSLEIID